MNSSPRLLLPSSHQPGLKPTQLSRVIWVGEGVCSQRYEIGTVLPLGEKRYTGNLYTCQPVTPPSPHFMMVSCLIVFFFIKKKYLIHSHKNANYIQVHERGKLNLNWFLSEAVTSLK